MKIGIIGLPQTGKKTLFQIITKHKLSANELAQNKPVDGIAEIIDPRFEKLVEMYKPESVARARINIVLLPKLEKGSIAKSEVLNNIDDVDVLCHIVRAFKDDSVYHADGSVNAKRDIDEINSELILNDLMFIEKRLERLEKNLKRASLDAAIKEKEVLDKLKACLDKEMPLRMIEIKDDEKKVITSYPLITRKEMIVVLNVSEEDLKNPELLNKFKKDYEHIRIHFMHVSAKIEAEIDGLAPEEKKEFLKEAGIDEPAVDLLKRVCIKALDLISFFGVGTDEVKQWTIKKGSTAPNAAGAIHSDLEKGFIRAEVMKYEELIALGSEEKVKEAGKFYLKGKEYVVEDGDILSVRFNL